MKIEKFSTLTDIAKQKKTKRLVVAAAEDKHVLLAVKKAHDENIINPVLVGNKKEIEIIAKQINLDIKKTEIISAGNPVEAAQKSVSIIRQGNADILMKGMISTGSLLKTILDKEKGLRKEKLLSHVAFFESPNYHKIFAVTDVAMNINPGLNEKALIINNAVKVFNKLGVANPKVAVIGAVETVNPDMEATIHAAVLSQMNKRGQINNCIVDGPLAIDNAISEKAAKLKKIKSNVAGDCDIILVPDINSGNILYKTLVYLGNATAAAIIMGAKVPFVLTSRSDNEKSKFLSIALATAME